MPKAGAWIVTILTLVVIGLVALAVMMASRPSGYEQAALIAAQGQARLDSGLALAGVIGAGGVVIIGGVLAVGAIVLLVIGLFGAITLFGGVITAISGVVLHARPQPPAQIVTERVIYLPSGQRRLSKLPAAEEVR